jgi:hypothetical protein
VLARRRCETERFFLNGVAREGGAVVFGE